MNAIDVIGFGLSLYDLTEKHKSIIKDADLVVAGKRHLELLKEIENQNQNVEQGLIENSRQNLIQSRDQNQNISRETLTITKDIEGLIAIIKDRVGQGKRIVVVASGDPLFYGIGGTLVNALGKDNVNIYPNISSVAAAFAAIKEPWHDAKFISLHGNSLDDAQDRLSQDRSCQINLSQKDTLKTHRLIAILTDHKKTPAWIAKSLIENDIFSFQMYVFENLGADNQNISFYGDIREVAEKPFLSPNVVILKRKELKYNELKCKELENESITLRQTPVKIYSGMEDNLFFHEKGLITKSEIRAIVLSKLQLISDDHIFWDLGAGSGSVSIEVSRFIPKGKIFSVEKNEQRIKDIKYNFKKFGLYHKERVGCGGGGSDECYSWRVTRCYR